MPHDCDFIKKLLLVPAKTHHGTSYLCVNDMANFIRERDFKTVSDPTGTIAKRKAIAAVAKLVGEGMIVKMENGYYRIIN